MFIIQIDSPYVFAAYNQQLNRFYEHSKFLWKARNVGGELKPVNLGDWFHERLVEWSASLPKGYATTHVFRKTSLQYALTGESSASRVAADARVSEGVLLRHYAKVTDPERREQSNRMFARIAASLDPEVALCYGHACVSISELERRLQIATKAKNWLLAAQLTGGACISSSRQDLNGVPCPHYDMGQSWRDAGSGPLL